MKRCHKKQFFQLVLREYVLWQLRSQFELLYKSGQGVLGKCWPRSCYHWGPVTGSDYLILNDFFSNSSNRGQDGWRERAAERASPQNKFRSRSIYVRASEENIYVDSNNFLMSHYPISSTDRGTHACTNLDGAINGTNQFVRILPSNNYVTVLFRDWEPQRLCTEDWWCHCLADLCAADTSFLFFLKDDVHTYRRGQTHGVF